MLSALGLPLLILVWGLMVQDIGISDSKAAPGIGATSSIAWPVLLILVQKFTTDSYSEIIGTSFVVIVALSCLYYSKLILVGGLDVLRFRAYDRTRKFSSIFIVHWEYT